jgi:hypothetical protein
MDRATCYDTIRPSLFRDVLGSMQVKGIDAILDASAVYIIPTDQLAYVLATVHNETGERMQPVEENLDYTKAKRIREVWPSRFRTDAAAALRPQPRSGGEQGLRRSARQHGAGWPTAGNIPAWIGSRRKPWLCITVTAPLHAGGEGRVETSPDRLDLHERASSHTVEASPKSPTSSQESSETKLFRNFRAVQQLRVCRLTDTK